MSVRLENTNAQYLHWMISEEALEPGPYILGERLSAVDFYFVMFPDWHMHRDGLLARYPNTARLREHVVARPAVIRIYGEHASN